MLEEYLLIVDHFDVVRLGRIFEELEECSCFGNVECRFEMVNDSLILSQAVVEDHHSFGHSMCGSSYKHNHILIVFDLLIEEYLPVISSAQYIKNDTVSHLRGYFSYKIDAIQDANRLCFQNMINHGSDSSCKAICLAVVQTDFVSVGFESILCNVGH